MSQFKDDIVAAEIVYFWFAANLTTGAAGDGATPLFDVRLAGAAAGAAPTASGTPTLLTHADYTDGLHEIAIDTTGYANGEYAVFCTLTISTVNPAGFVGSFRVRTANRIDAIKAKTDNLPSDPADASVIAGRFDTLDTSVADIPNNAEFAAALAASDDATLAAIAALNNLSAAQVNAEVVDALNVDTYPEPTGVPAATATLASKIGRLYQVLRNRVGVNATKKTFYDDADAALWEKDLSDDGTDYNESEGNAP